MSGWIKVEKGLENDPRVLRMAKAMATQFGLLEQVSGDEVFAAGNACALPGVTLVIGALARLWMYADSHARDDDSLDMSVAELDEWIGVPGFCSLMPADWLRFVDEHTVELPGYQAHNGVEAKKRALTQKRVQRHRNASKQNNIATSNASTLPDQDQTRPRPDKRNGSTQPTKLLPSAEPPPGLNAAAWSSWIDYRKEIQHPLKPASYPAAMRKLAAFGEHQQAVVDQSIANGWQGLFELKTDPRKPETGGNSRGLPRLEFG